MTKCDREVQILSPASSCIKQLQGKPESLKVLCNRSLLVREFSRAQVVFPLLSPAKSSVKLNYNQTNYTGTKPFNIRKNLVFITR